MPDWPLAFHITFGTYGTRLHGDQRPTVERPLNHYGEPFVEPNEIRRQLILNTMTVAPLFLTNEQRLFVESQIPAVCQRGGWEYRVCAAQPDHVHTLLSTGSDPKVVRNLLKRWLTEYLSAEWKLNERPRWWADGGSAKYVWDQEYFENAFEYIRGQRTTTDAEDQI